MQHRHLQKRHVQCDRQKSKEGEVAPVRLCKMNAALFQVFQSKRQQRQRTERYALDRHLHGRERAAEGLERDLGRRIEHGRQQNIEVTPFSIRHHLLPPAPAYGEAASLYAPPRGKATRTLQKSRSAKQSGFLTMWQEKLLGGLGSLLVLPLGNAQRAGDVARDVQAGTTHVEETVDAVDDHDHIDGNVHRLEHHGKHDHARARRTGRADGGKRCGDDDGNHLSDGQRHAAAGGEEDGGNALVDGGTVHVDRRAEGDNERRHIVLCAQLICALLAQGDRSGGGGGGKCENHRGGSLLEEGDGADARKDLGRERVAENRVDNVSEVGATKHDTKRRQDLGALRGDNPCHHREHADGAEGNDERHHALDDRIERRDKILGKLPLLTRGEDTAAEHQCDHDDLQHVGFCEGLPHIAREDGDQRIHEVGARRLIPHSTLFQRERGKQAGIVEDVRKEKADDAGDCRGDEEVSDRLPADGADLLHIAHRDDTVDHRQQHDGHNNELEEIDEDGAEGLQVVGGQTPELTILEISDS